MEGWKDAPVSSSHKTGLFRYILTKIRIKGVRFALLTKLRKSNRAKMNSSDKDNHTRPLLAHHDVEGDHSVEYHGNDAGRIEFGPGVNPTTRSKIGAWAVVIAVLNVVVTSLVMRIHDRSVQPKALPVDTTDFPDAVPFGEMGMRGISHVCVNVNDVDEAVEFYHRVLGYEVMNAGELWGDFDMRHLTDESFCKSAGFMDGKCDLDCVWMKHPTIHLNLELFHYYSPNVTNRLQQKGWQSNTQDIGGIKHISYAVENATAAFEFLRRQHDVRMISSHPLYKPVRMSPLPFKFFYWLDPYGVQWECEEGDKIVTHQVAGLTRLMDEYVQYK